MDRTTRRRRPCSPRKSFQSFTPITAELRVHYRRWLSPCHPSSTTQSSSYPLPPLNDLSKPLSRRHQLRFLASRLPYPLTVRVSCQTPSTHDTAMQSPLSPNAWVTMNGS